MNILVIKYARIMMLFIGFLKTIQFLVFVVSFVSVSECCEVGAVDILVFAFKRYFCNIT